ncbi:helix-turn-helix domain-containing protein [Flavivirga sp. 57AJ16]|uniref:helix-turn-helix domain-containing protein n=1 Tax=Flavivirga sp. 57AJ16 TaxID=3025307 RepID=UPI002366BC5C|nr:helix-turn-helix transcriptional regulator [Flavivirga sp. 57AJ16]MDD7887875.1 helix-turn-helix transcriptional regulator [Flavivirga sp. 57AJ16]
MKFDYPDKVRADFLTDVVKPMVKQRKKLGLSQEDVDSLLGVADRLVSKWECGVRSPTAFHLYCWADALKGQILFSPNEDLNVPIPKQSSNDNSRVCEMLINDNIFILPQKKIKQVC